MTREQFTECVGSLRAHLETLEKIEAGCRGCRSFGAGHCKHYGPIPAEFIPTGCDLWDSNDTPF